MAACFFESRWSNTLLLIFGFFLLKHSSRVRNINQKLSQIWWHKQSAKIPSQSVQLCVIYSTRNLDSATLFASGFGISPYIFKAQRTHRSTAVSSLPLVGPYYISSRILDICFMLVRIFPVFTVLPKVNPNFLNLIITWGSWNLPELSPNFPNCLDVHHFLNMSCSACIPFLSKHHFPKVSFRCVIPLAEITRFLLRPYMWWALDMWLSAKPIQK